MAKIIPIKDLKNTSEITEKCRTSDEPIFIIQNGHGDMMLMSMEVYNRTMAKMDLYQKQKKAEDQHPPTVSADKFMAEMKNQYEKLWDQVTSRGTKGYCRNARIYRCHLMCSNCRFKVI